MFDDSRAETADKATKRQTDHQSMLLVQQTMAAA